MIHIQNKLHRIQPNFWNHAVFHPTDAIEDPWGKKLLERFAADGAVKTVRLYAMPEDIVYRDEKGELAYDFRLNDLRLDTLLELGFEPMIAYAFIPDCIASGGKSQFSISYNKTRYKGKMLNTTEPYDYALWEEVCYEYTRHIIQRYGEERVASWHLHCYNEPDLQGFFLSHLGPSSDPESLNARAEAYCRLYDAFARGVLRASEKLCIGGPALASRVPFLEHFLNHVKESGVRLDYIALHNYGTHSKYLNSGERPFDVDNQIQAMTRHWDVIREYGFGDREVIYDEWGAASRGFANAEEAPAFLFREDERFAAYFVRLIHELIRHDLPVSHSRMMICLSGQHEMKTDFSGFRGFFTLNHFAKPIYQAHVLASRLGEELLSWQGDGENVFVLPTRKEKGELAVLLTHCSSHFEDIPPVEEALSFDEDLTGRQVTVWAIDADHTNPYALFLKMGSPAELTQEDILRLRREGELKPVDSYTAEGNTLRPLTLKANGCYFVTVEK